MSISPTVDARYRLQPADLEGAPRRVIISNVTFQGLEEMTPVLHFEGQTKRLVLSADQVTQLVELTGTSLFHDWIGRAIVLSPLRGAGGREISITAPTRRAAAMPVEPRGERREWRMALTVVALLSLASTAYYFLVELGWLAYGLYWLEQFTN